MQNDGNLVLYTKSGEPIWASNTASASHDYDKINKNISSS